MMLKQPFDGAGSSDIALAKSGSYSTLTWWVLNRWIVNKQLRFDTVACEHCRQSTVALWSGWILCIGTVDKHCRLDCSYGQC
jgi:hypothetical protein